MTVEMLREHDALITSYARWLYRHYQRMFAGLLPLTEDDFVQIARIAVWRAPDHERVVVRAVIRWRCTDEVRRIIGREGHSRKVVPTVSFDADPNPNDRKVDLPDARDDYAALDTRMLLRNVLDLAPLTERERDVLMDHVRGVRQYETAARLGISRSRVSQLLARAQAKARLVVAGCL